MLIVLGILLLFLSGVLVVVEQAQQRSLRALKSAEAMAAGDLAKLAQGVRDELGESGRFHQMAELQGVVRCDAPLTSELAHEACVYYETVVTREFTRGLGVDFDDMSRRRRRRRLRREARAASRSEVVSRSVRSVPFWLEDATGRVQVNPSGAKLEPVRVVDRFDPGQLALPGGTEQSLALTSDLSRALANVDPGTRTVGYHLSERIIPVGGRAYVVGEADDSSGELTIGLPADRGKQLVVSTRSKNELMRSRANTVRWLLYCAGGSGALGLVLIALGLAS